MTPTTDIRRLTTVARRAIYGVFVLNVHGDYECVGHVTKIANTKTETHPWQALSVNCDPRTGKIIDPDVSGPGFLLGSFYGKNGKDQAVSAVLADAQAFTSARFNPSLW